MKTYTMRPLGRNRRSFAERQPDLFVWAQERAEADPVALPRAALHLARRFALSPHHARAVAELAGFTMENRP